MTLQITYKKQGKLDTSTRINQANFSYTLGQVIKNARVMQNCSLRELSRRTGVSTTVLTNIERGSHPCPPKTIFRCFEALKITKPKYEQLLLACAEPYHGIPNFPIKQRLEKTLIEYGIPLEKIPVIMDYIDYTCRTS